MRAVRICTASGCDRSADRRADGQSVCSMHFFRWKRLGDVNAPVKERAAPGVKHPCSVDGCELDKRTNGYCDKHYQRVRRLGGIEAASEWAGLTQEERFWKHVNKAGPDDCWEWSGNFNNKGYGVFAVYRKNARKKYLAHRHAVRLLGLLDESLVILHKCDNPPCCNPNHLRQGTQGDNIRDAIAKGRMTVPRKRKQIRRRAA